MHPTTIVASSIFTPIAKPIADVLAGFYAVIPDFGVAIILLSLAWMIVISPLTLKSTRSMLAMQKLQPQLKKLQNEHRNDRQAFAQAQMELFKEHGVSPFGSCLPSILPLPVFFALFRVIDGLSHHSTVVVNGTKTIVATPSFLAHNTQMYKAIVKANGHINAFGLDLSKNALSGHSSLGAALPFYLLLLIMIGTQYLQTVQMMSRNKAAQDNPQMKMMKYLPIVFGVICVRFPAGVILYYATSNLCRIAQQSLMYRYDPKVKALAAQEIIEVEATTKRLEKRDTAPNPARSGGRFREALAAAAEQRNQARDAPKPKADDAKKRPAGTGGATKNGSRPSAARPSSARPNGTKGTANGTAATGNAAGGRNGRRSNANGSTNGTQGSGTDRNAAAKGATSGGRNGNGATNGKSGANGNGAKAGATGGDSAAPAPKPQPAKAGRTGGGRTGAQPRRPRKGGSS